MPKSRRTRNRRRQGGALNGAALNYSLAGSNASRMALAQGGDFFKYHAGQHGGCNGHVMGAPLSAIDGSVLQQDLHGAARINGLDASFKAIAGMQDGGRRRRSKRSCRSKRSGRSKRSKSLKRSKRSKSSKSSKRSKRSKSSKRSKRSKSLKRTSRRTRRRGGALGYSPFPGQGMLMSSNDYSRAGLNPEWKSAVEFDSAMLRQGL